MKINYAITFVFTHSFRLSSYWTVAIVLVFASSRGLRPQIDQKIVTSVLTQQPSTPKNESTNENMKKASFMYVKCIVKNINA